jgi:prepilin-type N-terminal cleavage/methylation domain-containing protein
MRIISNGRTTTGERRAGFTLVEMLIVLTIILILVGLLAAAVIKVLALGPQAQVNSELNSFANAIGAYQTEFNVKYLPSQLMLVEDGDWNSYVKSGNQYWAQLATDSLTYLQQVFGSRALLSNTQAAWSQQPLGFFIDWNGDGQMYPTKVGGGLNPPMVLEGQHVLVFLLGGMQGGPFMPKTLSTSNTCLGFSTDPVFPYALPVAGSTSTRRGPFFDFKVGTGTAQQPTSGRLVVDQQPIGGGNAGTPLNFCVYIDPYNKVSPQPTDGTPNGTALANLGWTGYPYYLKQPYAFFSSYRSQNGYNRYGTLSGLSDCRSLAFGKGTSAVTPPVLQPYYVPGSATINIAVSPFPTSATYINANSYQILCAGPDGVWGSAPPSTVMFAGGAWPGAAGVATPGVDDWGNFSRTFLGSPQSN